MWQSSGLGRGAATGLSADQFDDVVFAQPYFDPNGLILACEGTNVVGFAHAGFGADAAQQCLCCDHGVICAVIVEPAHRRKGIGRRLIELAEEYLRGRGAVTIQAGPAWPCDPFYFGVYGGSQPAGFLESDENAKPFFEHLGYVPAARHLVFQRKIRETSDPVGLKLISIRRATQLAALQSTAPQSWWWQTRPGRLDTVRLGLIPKSGGDPFASVTLVGLDLYIPCWQTRAIGLLDLQVPDRHRGQGYDQALLVEVCRHVREELVGLAEIHCPADDAALIAMFQSAAFQEVDAGVVYRKA